MIKLILFLLDWGVPRFITEEVAIRNDMDGFTIVCSLSDIMEGEIVDAIGTVKSFNFFGYGLFPLVTNIRAV